MRCAVIRVCLVVSLLLIPLPGASAAAAEDVFVAQPAMRPVTLTGYTRARHVMDIVSEEAGRCIKVTADVGDTIAKDGVFASLDRTYIDLAIRKNRKQQERLENTIQYYGKEAGRFEELVRRESASQSKLDSLGHDLREAELELQGLKVEEATLKERWARHMVRVPSGWTIAERAVEPGEWIAVGRHLGKAGDFQTLLVPFSLSPEEYTALKNLKGLPELHFPDEVEGDTTLKAVLERVSPAFDPETRKISVDLAVRKGLSEMRGGLRAELTLFLPDPSGAVLAPSSAVKERYEEFWLTRPNGEQVRVMVLGNGPQSAIRVRSPHVKPGDKFKLKTER
jgi:RND family efflux transporter MFP subunit